MADITNVITVSLLKEGALALADNMNVVSVITSDQTVLSTTERYRSYRTASAVAADFGSANEVTQYANIFFATQPNSVQASGAFIVSYWRGAEEIISATPARLRGVQLNETEAFRRIRLISNGGISLSVDGAIQEATGLDFRSSTSMNDVVALLEAEFTGVNISFTSSRFAITSDTTGSASTLSYFHAVEGFDNVGTLMGLNDGGGAILTQGQATQTLTPETKLEALTEIKKVINIKGACFISQLLDNEVVGIAEFAKANNMLIYNVFSGADYLLTTETNPAWQVTLSGSENFRMLYSPSGNRKLACSYMARAHTVLFNAENSAMTMNLKTLSVAPDDLSQTVIDKALTVGMSVYTTIKNLPVVLESGSNEFTDNVYNLMAFVNNVEIDLFNVLKATSTKIPQTIKGVNKLITEAEKTTRRFVRAGVFAPGTWSSPDSFGDIEVFNRSIEERGFYWLAGSLADQPQNDRQQRISPVLQCAVKNAGAIHKVNVIINFNY